jgi:phytoene synthase
MEIQQHLQLFDKVCEKCSHVITSSYSTSFSLGILCFDKKFRAPIRDIYGFVRFADEIVDTFHGHDKQILLHEFRDEAYKAIHNGISLNPVLHSFQLVVNKYSIPHELIDAFLFSMEMDLTHEKYREEEYNKYIFGSAEVVGLMCLRVFCEGDEEKYNSLVEPAKKLGAAFQKINFLRDLKSDYWERGRVYFPSVKMNENFDAAMKRTIEEDIARDFKSALSGIKKLPAGSKLGVYIAYIYFYALLGKIRRLNPDTLLNKRVSVSSAQKFYLFTFSYLRYRLNLL